MWLTSKLHVSTFSKIAAHVCTYIQKESLCTVFVLQLLSINRRYVLNAHLFLDGKNLFIHFRCFSVRREFLRRTSSTLCHCIKVSYVSLLDLVSCCSFCPMTCLTPLPTHPRGGPYLVAICPRRTNCQFPTLPISCFGYRSYRHKCGQLGSGHGPLS